MSYPDFDPIVDPELAMELAHHVASAPNYTYSVLRDSADPKGDDSTYVVAIAYETHLTIERVHFHHPSDSMRTLAVIYSHSL